jgi:hypothetical protein
LEKVEKEEKPSYCCSELINGAESGEAHKTSSKILFMIMTVENGMGSARFYN